MKAREGVMKNAVFGANLQRLYPVVEPNLSDSGCVDCVLEFLVQAGGRSLPEVSRMMVVLRWISTADAEVGVNGNADAGINSSVRFAVGA
jgi:glutamate synthase domain-containing protein 1